MGTQIAPILPGGNFPEEDSWPEWQSQLASAIAAGQVFTAPIPPPGAPGEPPTPDPPEVNSQTGGLEVAPQGPNIIISVSPREGPGGAYSAERNNTLGYQMMMQNIATVAGKQNPWQY